MSYTEKETIAILKNMVKCTAETQANRPVAALRGINIERYDDGIDGEGFGYLLTATEGHIISSIAFGASSVRHVDKYFSLHGKTNENGTIWYPTKVIEKDYSVLKENDYPNFRTAISDLKPYPLRTMPLFYPELLKIAKDLFTALQTNHTSFFPNFYQDRTIDDFGDPRGLHAVIEHGVFVGIMPLRNVYEIEESAPEDFCPALFPKKENQNIEEEVPSCVA